MYKQFVLPCGLGIQYGIEASGPIHICMYCTPCPACMNSGGYLILDDWVCVESDGRMGKSDTLVDCCVTSEIRPPSKAVCLSLAKPLPPSTSAGYDGPVIRAVAR